jgi:hypothetical protein
MSGLIGFQKLLQILFEISFGKQMYIKKRKSLPAAGSLKNCRAGLLLLAVGPPSRA